MASISENAPIEQSVFRERNLNKLNGPSKPAVKAVAEAVDVDDDDEDKLDENIFLFIPNLIGYSRVVLAVASLHYMPLHPRTCSFLYGLSQLLDALDGHAARMYDQQTKFGAVLDMVTDRCTTVCLMVFLSSAFPRFSILFQGLISLDFASHYIHMYTTLATGGSNASHKQIDKSHSKLLNLYYSDRTVLFIMCAGNELFWIALYLLSFSSPTLSPQLLAKSDPSTAAAASSGSPFLSPWSAGAMELARANKMDSSVPWVLFAISFPVMLAKQCINVVQLLKACWLLADGDLEQRREQRRQVRLAKAVQGR